MTRKSLAPEPDGPNTVAIYFLVDPRQPQIVRYVGRSENPLLRHLQHCQELGTSRKGAWIHSLRQSGILPQMIVADWTNPLEADQAEREWIARLKPDLTNGKLVSSRPSPVAEEKPAKPQRLPARSESFEATKRRAIEQALAAAGGNKLHASRMLGIGRQTLYNKLTEYGLYKPHQRQSKGQAALAATVARS